MNHIAMGTGGEPPHAFRPPADAGENGRGGALEEPGHEHAGHEHAGHEHAGHGNVGAGPAGAGTWRARVHRLIDAGSRPGPWKRGPVLAALALLLGLVMLLHAEIPNGIGSLGSLVETFLPWLGLLVPVLLAAALLRRSAAAVAALLLPVLVWLHLFGGLLGDRSHPGGDLTVAEHNVDAGNPDPAGTARDLAASGADVLALVELADPARIVYEKELATAYPYHAVLGTVGIWSRLPLSGTRPIDAGMDYGPLAATKPAGVSMAENRALRTTVATAHGPLAVYVAHLASVRVNPRAGFGTGQRDRGVQALASAVAADPTRR
ncbi:hypothetical protein, partial [Actinacidiphila rubida]